MPLGTALIATDARVEAELCDCAGNRFHRTIAGAALAVAPLGVAGGEAGLVLLLIPSVLRIKVLWRSWLQGLRSPITVALAGLCGWIGLSLLWSPDPWNGTDRLQCMRALLWAPLLYPLLRDGPSRVALLIPLLAGITALAATQLWAWTSFMMGGGLPGADPVRFGGLHGELGKAGIWSGAGVCIGLFLAAGPRLPPGARIAAAGATLCCLGGLVACATLRVVGGVAVGLLASWLVSIACSPNRGETRRRIWIFIPIAIALAAFWLATQRRLTAAPSGFDARSLTADSLLAEPSADDASSHRLSADVTRLPALDSLQPRLLWWRACWHGFTGHPLAGRGWGSTPTLILEYPGSTQFVAENPRVGALHPELLTTTQPHSTYMMALGELGAVGAGLVIAIALLSLRSACSCVRRCLELAGPAAATLMWLIAAAGDTVFNAAVFAAGAISMAFAATLPVCRSCMACGAASRSGDQTIR